MTPTLSSKLSIHTLYVIYKVYNILPFTTTTTVEINKTFIHSIVKIKHNQSTMFRHTNTHSSNHDHDSKPLGVKKSSSKQWRRSPVNPPVPPKVYKVEPRGFRQLVQSLTGATSSVSTFREAAPEPLDFLNQQACADPLKFEVGGNGIQSTSDGLMLSPSNLMSAYMACASHSLFSP